jgi:hypothetical protein
VTLARGAAQHHGFRLTEWEVDPDAAWDGRHQVAFDLNRAKALAKPA